VVASTVEVVAHPARRPRLRSAAIRILPLDVGYPTAKLFAVGNNSLGAGKFTAKAPDLRRDDAPYLSD